MRWSVKITSQTKHHPSLYSLTRGSTLKRQNRRIPAPPPPSAFRQRSGVSVQMRDHLTAEETWDSRRETRSGKGQNTESVAKCLEGPL